MGDDHLNPNMRPSVIRFINKVNGLDVMQDPMNRQHILASLAQQLTVLDTIQLISTLMYRLMYEFRSLPFLEPLHQADSSTEWWEIVRTIGVYHEMVPLEQVNPPHKRLNKCRVCGQKKNHEWHSARVVE